MRRLPVLFAILGGLMSGALSACDRAGPAKPSPSESSLAESPPDASDRPSTRPDFPTPPPEAPEKTEPPPIAAVADRPPTPPRTDAPVEAASGGILPLARVLEILRARAPGEVLEVELDEDDDDDDPPVYEIKVLTAEGRVLEAQVDARTGTILELEED